MDGRAEITSADRELAQLLRKTGKPITLAVNKVDTGAKEVLLHDFYSLGIKDMYPVSAEHGLGMDDFMLHITEGFPEGTPEELAADAGERPSIEAEEKIAAGPIKVAIIGRPNAGKSTLLNALVGEERAIVSPIAGTTRDGSTKRFRRGYGLRVHRHGGHPAQGQDETDGGKAERRDGAPAYPYGECCGAGDGCD